MFYKYLEIYKIKQNILLLVWSKEGNLKLKDLLKSKSFWVLAITLVCESDLPICRLISKLYELKFHFIQL